MDLIKSKCYKIIMTGLNEFTLYELPSIKIDGNSEQIFYVNRVLLVWVLPCTYCLEVGDIYPFKSTHYNSKIKTS